VKIFYYCQHVLGLGHFYRSLEICRGCSVDHDLTMIIGGPDIEVGDEPFSFLQLPGMKMDDQFGGLISCDPNITVDEGKEMREKQLLTFFNATTPDCLILELYPFGRKAFRFELSPLLEAAEQNSCKVFCSLRDILVEKKEEREKHEERAVDTLNYYFHSLLVHADPKLVTLDTTFDLMDRIEVPVHYTGFVTPKPRPEARTGIRQSLGLGEGEKMIVVSIGSGSVGSHLLEAIYQTAQPIAQKENCQFRFFTGPYCSSTLYQRLAATQHPNIAVDRFVDNFVDWLAAADLSISMAGYNTSMNILAAGVPALMLPFSQNRE